MRGKPGLGLTFLFRKEEVTKLAYLPIGRQAGRQGNLSALGGLLLGQTHFVTANLFQNLLSLFQ
jgi:hypothetical protein